MEPVRGVVGGNDYVREFLRKDNYEDWSVQMKTYLRGRNLWYIVKQEKPVYRVESDIKTWKENDAKARHLIQISCGDEAFALIRDKNLAKKAWETLAESFASKDLNDSLPITQGRDEDYTNFLRYKRFFDAVRKGDWDIADQCLACHPEAVRQTLSSTGKTALHVAVSAGHMHVVERLVQLMSADDLELKRKGDEFTALAIATERGNIKMAKLMVEKNPKLLAITDDSGSIPVTHAVMVGQKLIARFFYDLTPLEDLESKNSSHGIELLTQSVYMENFDIALKLLKRCPNLIFKKDEAGDTVAFTLAMKPYGFHSGNRLGFYHRLIYKCLRLQPLDEVNHTYIDVHDSHTEDSQSNEWDLTKLGTLRSLLLNPLGRMASTVSSFLGITGLYKLKLAHDQAMELLKLICKRIESFDLAQIEEADIQKAVIEAARTGFVEFIMMVTQANPDLICTSELWRSMFRIAIGQRCARVFSLIYGLASKHEITSYYDEFGNSVWHTAGELAPERQLNLVPGAALQMQRELQWFKEVGETLTETTRKLLNNDEKTAREVFTHQHKILLTAGEKWMKETAASCSLVGALIVTVMFTAAFTVPGGTHQERDRPEQGYPVFLTKKLFKVFIIADVVSFSSATTSVLVFLGILTSRYAEEDFLKSLPKKMIVGLASLCFSIAAIMVAFCSTLLIMFHHERRIVLPLVLLASVPAVLVAWIKLPLLVEICKSTYGRSIFDKKMKNCVYGDTTSVPNQPSSERSIVHFPVHGH